MPFASSVGAPGPQYAIYNDSDDEMIPSTYQQQESLTIWDRLRGRGHRPAVPPPQSGYLTLIPLSDSRLKPQNTSLIVGCLVSLLGRLCMPCKHPSRSGHMGFRQAFLSLLHSRSAPANLQLTLAIASVCGVFFLVPRGVTVGSIQVRASVSTQPRLACLFLVLVPCLCALSEHCQCLNGQQNISGQQHSCLRSTHVGNAAVLKVSTLCCASAQVHSSQISFNTSKSTYQILLTATIPVYNPNYLRVSWQAGKRALPVRDALEGEHAGRLGVMEARQAGQETCSVLASLGKGLVRQAPI